MATTIQSGVWSDPAVWSGGVLPDATRDAILLHDLTIDDATAKRVDVGPGVTATLAGDIHCHGSFVVSNGATLTGSSGGIYFHVADDRLFTGNTTPGPNPADPDDHSGTDFGLWGLTGSHIELDGPEVTPRVDVLPVPGTAGVPALPAGAWYPATGAGKFYPSSVPIGWQTGDVLLLTSVRGGYALGTFLSLASDGAVFYTGAVGFSAEALEVEDQWLYPKAANLSRRIVVASADVLPGDYNHRAHTICMHSHGCFNYVEFRDLGPRAKLGRYPVHFHHGHAGAADQSRAVGCSFWQRYADPGNRFVAIHNITSVTVDNCVGLRGRGHGFFQEAGTEVDCVITNNLSVDVSGPEELTVVDSAVTPLSHHYWLRAGNTIAGNVAVGTPQDLTNGTANNGSGNGSASVALIVLSHKVTGLAAPDVVVPGHEAYGVGRYGAWAAIGSRLFSLPDSKIAYCGQAATGQSLSPHGTFFQYDRPLWCFNGGANAQYGSQLYLNSHRDARVVGGILLGDTAIDIHYNTKGSLTGTKVRCNKFLVRTYFAMGFLVEDCDLLVTSKLLLGGYPSDRAAPGLCRFANCRGTVLGNYYDDANPYAADYTQPNADFDVPGFMGTVTLTPSGEARKLLLQPAPQTGFVKPPAGAPSSGQVWQWQWAPTGGTLGTKYATNKQVLADWQASTLLGYCDGFPPGTYDVKVTKPDGTVVGLYTGVVVSAGQVTQL